MQTCSCGNAEAHIIARRKTATGTPVALWSDGGLTSGMGFQIQGMGVARTQASRDLNVEAGWLFIAACELHENHEIVALAKSCRKAVRARAK